MSTAPVAVFDSGVGGLSVLLELVRELPAESFLYYAVSALAGLIAGSMPTKDTG
jgi:glutamate racemase